MKQILKLIISAFILLAIKTSHAQNPNPITIKEISLKPNAVGGFSLSVDFRLDINSDEIFDDEYWSDKNKLVKFHITYAGKSNSKKNCLTANPFATKSGFGFQITGFNNASLNQFLAKDDQISVEVDEDVQIQLLKSDGKTVSRTGILKKEDVNNMIAENLSITDDERTSYLTYLNNFYYYENSIDFGVEPSDDSATTSYFLTFQFQNRYNIKNLLSCTKNTNKAPHLFWSLSGRLSTNFDDALNHIYFYPVNLQFSNYLAKLPWEANIKVGNESNETFVNKRVVIDASSTFIIPNLVNLTTASSNRLRLKPIIIGGIKAYYDYSNNATNFFSGQAYLNFHYYIPVINNYAIIIDENPFYDFSNETNPKHKMANSYSIILGAEIPGTGFKAMLKYVNGKSDLNYKQGEIIGIGLLADLFQEKNK
jgi:hypothetical protein